MVRIKNSISAKMVKRMAVRVPEKMISKISENIESSGYNKKQRLFWFEDILRELFEKEDCYSLIAEEFIKAGTTKVINLSITVDTFKQLDKIVKAVEEEEGSKKDRSSIIRTAILQRLINSNIQTGS